MSIIPKHKQLYEIAKKGGEKQVKKIGLVVIMLVFGASTAFAFDLGGYVGPIQFKFYDWTIGRQYAYVPDTSTWVNVDRDTFAGDPYAPYRTGERASLPNGGLDMPDSTQITGDGVEDSWGIIGLTQITAGFDTLWYSGKDGEYIKGFVKDYDDVYITSTATGFGVSGIGVGQTGGVIELYIGSEPLDYTQSPDDRASDPYNATELEPFLRFTGVPGIGPSPDFTRWEIIDGLTSPFTGKGAGYLAVDKTFGWGSTFDSNLYDGVYPGTDSYAVFDFGDNIQGFTREQFDALSSDPAFGGAVPEPASILLLGGGLLGLAAIGRRKKRT